MNRGEVFVFSGPTLAPARVEEVLPEARCLGPVQRGDVLGVLRQAPTAICILDGLFGGALPVWHKEILWAIQQGVRVYGASSMGALRAAELAPFGMIGVGRIFEAIVREELEDEDEVTVVHAGAERGYRATSDALVDMRATLEAALERGIIDAGERARLVGLARGIFYAERSYAALLAGAEQAGIAGETRQRLADFLRDKNNHQSIKRDDALECLDRVRRDLALGASGAERAAPAFEFSHTDAFDALLAEESAASAASSRGQTECVPSELLVQELQLLGPEVFEPLLRQATARALRVVVASGERGGADVSELDLLREQSVHELDQLQRLLEELDLSPASYRAWMREEARVQSVEEQTHAVLQEQFAPLLRALGDYPRVAQRARRKLQLFGPLAAPVSAEHADDIWRAYFEGALNLDVPDDLDAYAVSVGFADRSHLFTAVAREVEFRRRG